MATQYAAFVATQTQVDAGLTVCSPLAHCRHPPCIATNCWALFLATILIFKSHQPSITGCHGWIRAIDHSALYCLRLSMCACMLVFHPSCQSSRDVHSRLDKQVLLNHPSVSWTQDSPLWAIVLLTAMPSHWEL
jgi:hypothetical protein